MNFQGQGRPVTEAGLLAACTALAVSPAEIWTVLAVETRAFGFLADRRPQMLFERHVFHQRTNGRYDAVDSNISNPVPGGYAGNMAEYDRLDAAMTLDRDAALCSASWGVGQVMGFHFDIAGFANVTEMVAAMVSDEDTQLLAVTRFLNGSSMRIALQQRDWAAFAKGYNGPDFRRNGYDTRLAEAYTVYSTTLPDLALRTAQTALLYLGFDPGPIDGIQGPRTRGAVTAFQRQQALPVSGALDLQTESALVAKAWPADG